MKSIVSLRSAALGFCLTVVSSCVGIEVKGELSEPNRVNCRLDGYLLKEDISTEYEVVCILNASRYQSEVKLLDDATALACRCGADGMVFGIKDISLGKGLDSGRKTSLWAIKYKVKPALPQGISLTKMRQIFACRDAGNHWRQDSCE